MFPSSQVSMKSILPLPQGLIGPVDVEETALDAFALEAMPLEATALEASALDATALEASAVDPLGPGPAPFEAEGAPPEPTAA
jgi:hypothetical protein